MTNTVHHHYQGWDVTIRCMETPAAARHSVTTPAYSASARVVLQHGEDPADWIDSRVQLVSLGSRSFASRQHCIDILLTDIKALIGALVR